MSEAAERDRIKELVEGQGQVAVEGSVDYAAAASFSYISHDGYYVVTVSQSVPPVLEPVTPKPAPKAEDKVVDTPAPAPTPKVSKPATKPDTKIDLTKTSPSRVEDKSSIQTPDVG